MKEGSSIIEKIIEKRLNFRIIAILAILTMLSMSIFQNYITRASLTTGDVIEKNKTAIATGNSDEFKITLEIDHKPVLIPDKDADIIVVIDRSESMTNKIEAVKSAVSEFCNTILENSAENVRISIISYSGPSYSEDQPTMENSTEIISNFSSDNQQLVNALVGIEAENGSYTAGGMRLVKAMLGEAREDANKYVVFFADGPPNRSSEKDLNILGLEEVLTDPYYSGFSSFRKIAMYEYKQIEKVYGEGLKFYTIGVFTGKEDREPEVAKFLSRIQNVIGYDEYSNKYYTENVSVMGDIFKDISNDIKSEISNTILINTVIKDIVADEFEIIPNSYECTDNINSEALQNTVVNGQEITFNLGNVIGKGSVSFLVKTKDPYFGGNDIDTNVNATIECIDGNTGNEVNEEFNIPNVDIPYKKGSIMIEKVVEDEGGNVVESNESFTMSINGKGENDSKYNVELQGNSNKTMEFYLKGINTNISNNTDTTLNYFTVGEFVVNETIPMNYELISIQIWDKINNLWLDLGSDTFVLDKDNPNIKIKVTNRLINDSYWFDNAECENEFNN